MNKSVNVNEFYSTGTSRRESDYTSAEYCSTKESDCTAALRTNLKFNINLSVSEKHYLFNYRTIVQLLDILIEKNDIVLVLHVERVIIQQQSTVVQKRVIVQIHCV